MKRLLGWAVLLGLLVFAVSYVSAHWPDGNRFGCAGTGCAVAHADDSDCPPDITTAESDPGWAADRIAAINLKAVEGRKYTYGEFYDPDGTEHWFVSGQDGDADTARDVGRRLPGLGHGRHRRARRGEGGGPGAPKAQDFTGGA